jgi:putative ABC transport system ATP-binding protein
MVTHNDPLRQMADRVVRLHDGGIRRNYMNENKLKALDIEW